MNRQFEFGLSQPRKGVAVAAMALGLAFAGCGADERGTSTEADGVAAQAVSAEVASSVAGYKASHDTEPRPVLSKAEQAALANKEQQARAHYQAKLQSRNRPVGYANYAGNYLSSTQQGQWTGYYCGPAAVVEALAIRGQGWDQNSAAAMMHTDGNGTAWYGINAAVPSPTGYPIRDTLNYRLGTSWYLPVAVSYNPTASETSTFQSNMTFDIDHGWPVIGDAWEAAGGPHLTGHPTNQTIFHWFTINGYGNWGGTTSYEDSATSIWGSVPAYTSNFNTSTLVIILGGRGYVW